MTPERWRQVERLYHDALALPASERALFLASACGGDAMLQREVEELLAQPATTGPLDREAVAFAGTVTMDVRPLAAGTRIGVYEIRSLLGKGGMGEVYRARDSRLGRDVAIKVLPAAFTSDPDRLVRFEREARVLASLNHPNIATIYGLEEADGKRAIAMELIDGETLAARLGRVGALRFDDVLAIGRQIADALDAAHGKGIVHRDLKPANVIVSKGGSVKVLDFGLAKMRAADETASAPDVETLTVAATREGVVLGTPTYMSPEQARGLEVDKRTDIWAFGCVLYEMLTGRAPFAGATVTDTLSAVLDREPDWIALSRRAPAHVVHLLKRCLEKEPGQRLRDISAAIEMMRSESTPATNRASRSGWAKGRERLAWVSAVIVVAAAAWLGWSRNSMQRVPPPAELRLDLATPPTSDPAALAISPEGLRVAFAATQQGRSILWIRHLGTSSSTMVAGTDGAQQPFWSPDGRSVGFFADGKLKRIDIAGGNPLSLADAPDPRGGTWGADDQVLFTPTQISPIMRVAATGGEPTALTRLDAQQIGQLYPQFLPDGVHFLYVVNGAAAVSGTYVGRLDGAEPARRLLDRYAAYGPRGHLLFARETTLFAQAFDETRLALSGRPIRVADGVDLGVSTGADAPLWRPAISASVSGSIVYRAGSLMQGRQTIWFDRSGRQVGRVAAPNLGPAGAQQSPAISRDEQTIALVRRMGATSDVWMLDAARSTLTRLTFGGATTPIWSPDGRRIVFASRRNGNLDLFEKTMGDSQERPLLVEPTNAVPADWSADGKQLLFLKANPKTLLDVYAMSMDPRGPAVPIVQSPFEDLNPQLDPSGTWMAYQSNESGRHEVYLRPVNTEAGRVQVSSMGGTQPRWRGDGRELYYLALDGRLIAVPITFSPGAAGVRTGTPVILFSTQVGGSGITQKEYAVSRDGQRFLVDTPFTEEAAIPITVILNWQPGGTPQK